MIKIDDVSVSFGGLKAVDDVSFDMAGCITGLIGQTAPARPQCSMPSPDMFP